MKELVQWEKKKDGKTKALKIEKLEKEIQFLQERLLEIESKIDMKSVQK